MLSAKQKGLVIAGLAGAAGLMFALTLGRPDPGSPVASSTPEPNIPTADVRTLVASPHLLFRHTAIDANYSHMGVAPVAEPNSQRGTSKLACERVSFAAGRGICLQADRGVLTNYEAVLFDDQFEPRRSFKLDGRPSRTRVSPDGRLGAITVFVSGQEHGYSSLSGFSTKTILLDMASGDVLGDLETFKTLRDGTPFSAADFNFWGVTFARDSNSFYASLQSAKKTYLVQGDVANRTLTVLHENVECPSLSPNNRLIAYKKRVGGDLAPWRFYLLDVATMTERPLTAETRSIDDQIEWLDDERVLFAMARSSQSAIQDVWVAPIDGSAPARPFLSQADSPILVR
ncbi:MAG: hypothetical protein ABI665_19820 [Vicinamibacterales bacterium]